MTRFLVVLFASLVAASCAQVRTNVAVTHALPPAGAAKTVAILPYTNTLGARPDFQNNASKLAAQLQSKGYTIVQREKLTSRHAIMKKIQKRWPASWPGGSGRSGR